MQSTLEFSLRQQEFIELIRADRRLDAVKCVIYLCCVGCSAKIVIFKPETTYWLLAFYKIL